MELAEVGVVLGNLGDSEESTNPVAPSEAYLNSASDILAALHAGEVPFLDHPLGWQEWLKWRAGPGRRNPAMGAVSQRESQMW